MKRYQLVLFVIFATMAGCSSLLLNTLPPDVQRTTCTAETSDGILISYNLYVKSGLDKPTPVIAMGHGIFVNKEMMTNFAIELAARGFIVANIDWRGHGQSGGTLSRDGLILDLEAVLQDVPSRVPLADMTRLGLVGYSMGGGPTFTYATTHDEVKAWVGVGTSANGMLGNETTPANALVIVGTFDQAFSVWDARADMANLTAATSNAAEFQVNTLYGNLTAGTARMIIEVPTADHLAVPWDPTFVQETLSWFSRTFEGEDVQVVASWYWVRAVLVYVGLAGTAGIAYALVLALFNGIRHPGASKKAAIAAIGAGNDAAGGSDAAGGTSGNDTLDTAPGAGQGAPALENALPGGEVLLVDPGKDPLGRTVAKFFAFTLLLLPTAVLPGLSLLLPLTFTAFLVTIVTTLGLNTLVYTWYLAKRAGKSVKQALRDYLAADPVDWFKGIVMAAILVVPIVLVIHLNVIGMIPGVYRLQYLPIFILMLLFTLLVMGQFSNGVLRPLVSRRMRGKPRVQVTLAVGGLSFLLVYGWNFIVFMILSLAMGSFFFAIPLSLMIPIFLFTCFLQAHVGSRGHGIVPAAVVNAIILGLVVVTLSPLGSILSMFL